MKNLQNGIASIRVFFILILSLTVINSCSEIAKAMTGFKDPKIENVTSIKNYLRDNNMEGNVNLLPKDKNSFAKLLYIFNKKLPEAVLFDKYGNELEYKENVESCNAGLFRVIPSLNSNSSLKKGKQELSNIIRNYTIPISGLTEEILDGSDYYLLINWAKYVGKKNKDHVLEWEKLAMNNHNVKVKVIKVNMDFRDGWGLTNEDLKIKRK